MTPRWFFYVGGLSLIVLGVLQLYTRPRSRGESVYQRFINLGTLWSLICMTVGGALIAMALGYLQGPAGQAPPEPPRPPGKRRHY